MKKILFGATTLLLLGACSGTNSSKNENQDEDSIETMDTVQKPEEEVRSYGKYFVEKLNANQLDSLKVNYPDIANADSVVSVQSDSIIVVEAAPGQYEMTLADGVVLKVNRADDGNIAVTESKGLFAFPKDKIDIAKKTGMWDDNLTDAQLNERLKDEDFTRYLKKVKTVKTSDIISIGKLREPNGMMGGIEDTPQPLSNLTDIPISGKDYSVVVEYQWILPALDWDDTGFDSGKEVIPGKNIPAKGSVNFNMASGFRGYSKIVAIKWKLTPKQLQEKFAPYTGNEYQEYLDSKK